MVTVIHSDNFEKEVLQEQKTVLLDFWAEWCGPCRMLSPIVEKFAEGNEAVKVCKVNVDECGDIAAKYGIQAIPTLLVFRNGEEVNRNVGLCDVDALRQLVAE